MRTSVILPMFNAAPTIQRALRSVLDQTDHDFELLVVDDGSTDESADIAIRQKDPRVRLLRHPINRGISAARNTGLTAATGDFIAFIDADDEWNSRFLERMHHARGSAEAVACGREVVLPNGRVRRAHSRVQGDLTGAEAAVAMLTGKITPFPWDKMIARTAFDGLLYPEDIQRFEDLMIGVAALSRTVSVVSIPDPLIRYHVTGGSLTWGRVPRLEETDRAVEFAESELGTWLRHRSHARAFAVCRTLCYMLTAQSAMRSRDAVAADAVLDGCRSRLRPGAIATTLVRAPVIGAGAVLLKLTPRLYRALFTAYAKRQYALD